MREKPQAGNMPRASPVGTISVWKPTFERVYALVYMLADTLSQHTLLFHLGKTFRPKAKASVHEGR